MPTNYVSIRDAASRLGVSRRHIERLIDDRTLDAIDIARNRRGARPTIRITGASIEAFVEARKLVAA